MMTLDDAIKHCEEVADRCEYEASRYDMTDAYESHMACKEGECGEEHRQLAEWLKDYKRIKEREPLLEKIKEKYALMKADERKKGKWINKSHTIGCGIKFAVSECTCCGKKTFFDCDQLVYNYCPNCGAEMGSEE